MFSKKKRAAHRKQNTKKEEETNGHLGNKGALPKVVVVVFLEFLQNLGVHVARRLDKTEGENSFFSLKGKEKRERARFFSFLLVTRIE